MELVLPDYTLDELKAGAVIKFLINDRVPRDGDSTPAYYRLFEFFDNVFNLVDMHRLPIRGQALAPVKEPAMIVVLERGM